MSSVSATLVAWTSAWCSGTAASDDVIDALQTWAEIHRFCANDAGTASALELPDPDEAPVGPAMMLAALRRTGVVGGGIVLPIAGDVRGLGGKSSFADSAMRAGEAVLLGEAGLGIVPNRVSQDEIQWTVFDLPAIPGRDHTPLSQAEHDLSGTMRAAATALIELGVAKARPNVRDEIAAIVAETPTPPWPEGMPPRAIRVLQRATEVEAILQVASGDAPGAALSARTAEARSQALRPLITAVRSARCAAVEESVRILTDHADQQS